MAKIRRQGKNVDAEMAVLGACMILPSQIPEVRKVVSTSMFTSHERRAVWDAIRLLADLKRRVDATAVLEIVGCHYIPRSQWRSLLNRCISEVPHAAYGIHYAEIVRCRMFPEEWECE
jgi:replicative DNA helicase